jgi:hypothetical protein
MELATATVSLNVPDFCGSMRAAIIEQVLDTVIFTLQQSPV